MAAGDTVARTGKEYSGGSAAPEKTARPLHDTPWNAASEFSTHLRLCTYRPPWTAPSCWRPGRQYPACRNADVPPAWLRFCNTAPVQKRIVL